jgi:glucose-6-phosphate 1-dehydrogenase
MRDVKLSLTDQDIICAETPAPPVAVVVFGASGDLTSRKLLPSLMQISKRNLLEDKFYLLGTGRKNLSDKQFRQIAIQAIKEKCEDVSSQETELFVKKLYYISGDYSDAALYESIKTRLTQLDAEYKIDGNHIFYLAVPPFLYTAIVENLCGAGLSRPNEADSKNSPRLVVEKPFGRDLQSAIELDNKIRRCFEESQIYRIDHYLGKETVQNILMFRFANNIFEPLWNRNYIDHVQITIAEDIGIEHRGGYYDKAGALRDMFQSHMLQMLALVAMEPPTSFQADGVRDEKVKLLKSIRALEPENIVRGRYGPGKINGKEVIGYRSEKGVAPGSNTETFVAAKLFINNWRWEGVPFYLRTGKMLAHKDTELAITFKTVPYSMFTSLGLDDIPPNVLVLQIQPEEGISLSFQAKRPGSKMCMGTLNMSFCYESLFGVTMPEAYQRLLLDCMLADQTLFTRSDDVRTTWGLLTPVLQAWEKDGSVPFEYPAGSESFPQADALIESDGRKWRKLAAI